MVLLCPDSCNFFPLCKFMEKTNTPASRSRPNELAFLFYHAYKTAWYPIFVLNRRSCFVVFPRKTFPRMGHKNQFRGKTKISTLLCVLRCQYFPLRPCCSLPLRTRRHFLLQPSPQRAHQFGLHCLLRYSTCPPNRNRAANTSSSYQRSSSGPTPTYRTLNCMMPSSSTAWSRTNTLNPKCPIDIKHVLFSSTFRRPPCFSSCLSRSVARLAFVWRRLLLLLQHFLALQAGVAMARRTLVAGFARRSLICPACEPKSRSTPEVPPGRRPLWLAACGGNQNEGGKGGKGGGQVLQQLLED